MKRKHGKRRSKKDLQRRHAKRRARLRLGIKLDQNTLDQLIGRIESGQTEKVDQQSQRVSKHRVSVKGAECIAVYDNNSKEVVTFLTLDQFFKGPWHLQVSA